MRFSTTALTALALIAGSYGQSLYVQNDLSFGHLDKVSQDNHNVPKFTLMGDYPQIYSNKIMLTPPSPGNRRAAIWSENTITSPKWEANMEFRATGPEHASGRLHLWVVRDGFKVVGTSSVYTVGKFEGLAIVIDQYGHGGGMIRGFLNDGTKTYSQHLAVDGLAFGHADFRYRNLGRPSKVRVQQDWHNFRVEVDGVVAFETSTVRIPAGYNIGIGAASADNPDSFEIFSLTVTTDSAEEGTAYNLNSQSGGNNDAPPANEARNPVDPNNPKGHTATGYLAPERIPEDDEIKPLPATAIAADQEFADLHYRMQALMAHVLAFQRDFQEYQTQATVRHAGVLEQYAKASEARKFPFEQLDAMDRRLQGLEKMLTETKRDVGETNSKVETLRHRFNEGHGAILSSVHGSVGSLRGHLPQLGWVIFVVLGSQAGIILAFMFYKKRKSVGSKKYL